MSRKKDRKARTKGQVCSMADVAKIRMILENKKRLKRSYDTIVRCMRPGTLGHWKAAVKLQVVLEKANVGDLKHLTMVHAATIVRLSPEEEWLIWVEQVEANGWTVAELRKEMLLAAKEETAGAVKGEVAHGDAIEFLERIEEASVDLLLTDPPYMTDLEEPIHTFAARWLPVALSRLKPTGRAYICTGAYPEEIHAYLEVARRAAAPTLQQILVWTYRNTLGPAPAADYKANWQAIFYLRGPKCAALNCPVMTEQFSVQDIAAPDGRRAEQLHAWQKPAELAERFIRHATLPGHLVVDPFAGTGTFLLAAARLGRRAEGAERDPKMLRICRRRGLEVR